jgi:predicted HTH transcriptional regulator
VSATVAQLEEWLHAKEGASFEFKEAKNNFHFEKLAKCCCALANAGGGKMILGVTDRRPRRIGPNPDDVLMRTTQKDSKAMSEPRKKPIEVVLPLEAINAL